MIFIFISWKKTPRIKEKLLAYPTNQKVLTFQNSQNTFLDLAEWLKQDKETNCLGLEKKTQTKNLYFTGSSWLFTFSCDKNNRGVWNKKNEWMKCTQKPWYTEKKKKSLIISRATRIAKNTDFFLSSKLDSRFGE